MTNKSIIKLGVFGFGCVGGGLYEVLHKTGGIKAHIEKICVKNRDKKRSLPEEFFTYDKNDLLFNDNIDVIVELIDDSEAAFEIVSTALKNGKAVVTANKKMIAEHFEELLQLQQEYNVPLLYEGACCASIPIIRNLEEYYDNDLLTAVEGIFNGSTNYILTKIFDENLDFDTALKQAQEAGFAESDPRLDVEGFDPKYKLDIILTHAFGATVNPIDIFNYGITRLSPFDIQYAREKGYRIKLVAQCRKAGDKIVATVFPKFITPSDKLYTINNEYNGIVIESIFAETQFFSGKGAGAYPTASAVLSDISALTYNYKYEYKKLLQNPAACISNDFLAEVFVRFSDGSGLKPTDFETVKEFYSSGNNNFIIGEINYQTLVTSNWIKSNEVSVIFTASPLKVTDPVEELAALAEA